MKHRTYTAQPKTKSTEHTMILSRLISTIMITFIPTTAHAQNLDEWFQAAKDGNQATIQTFITNRFDLEATNVFGWTALMRTSWLGHTDTATLLIANGANVNAVSEFWGTEFILASELGHTDTATLLLANGAEVNCC